MIPQLVTRCVDWGLCATITHEHCCVSERHGTLIKSLVTSAMAWCDGFSEPLLVPLTGWLQAPLPSQIKSNAQCVCVCVRIFLHLRLCLCDRRRERTGRCAVGAALGHRPARGPGGARSERGATLARHVRHHGLLVRRTLGTHHLRRGHRPGAAHRRRGPLRHHLGPQDQNAETQNDVSACNPFKLGERFQWGVLICSASKRCKSNNFSR